MRIFEPLKEKWEFSKNGNKNENFLEGQQKWVSTKIVTKMRICLNDNKNEYLKKS